ncbi:MAG: hypothetical protein LBU65_04235, partial [Planctomycetaceae bacterium]|nr:hypothetical protein [Planctomycetaceae bacterium]
ELLRLEQVVSEYNADVRYYQSAFETAVQTEQFHQERVNQARQSVEQAEYTLSYRQAQVLEGEEGNMRYPNCDYEAMNAAQARSELNEARHELERATADRMKVERQVEEMQQLLYQVKQLQEQTQAALRVHLAKIDSVLEATTSRLTKAEQELGGYLNTSTLGAVMTASSKGFAAPSQAVQIGLAVAETARMIATPPGTDDVIAQGVQAVANGAAAAMGGFMEATIRQHGTNAATNLQNLQIQQAITEGGKDNV